jgi:hypothetical protein
MLDAQVFVMLVVLELTFIRLLELTFIRLHRGCTIELEADIARLQSELEQSHQALADTNTARSSLFMSREELE